MFKILKEKYFMEYYTNGFIETNISLSNNLVNEIQEYYARKKIGHNDFPKFFDYNEHLAYMMQKKFFNFFLKVFPKFAKISVKNFYNKSYSKAVYCEQIFIKKVLKELSEKGFFRFFKAHYMLVSYDMYLHSNHLSSAAGIHSDLPNFHHFYETENDLSIYIPLVDLNYINGGKLKVLPEKKLKIPGNMLLKLLYEYFSKNIIYLDKNNYIDPNLINYSKINSFIKSTMHQELMSIYKNMLSLVKTQYINDFTETIETKGKVLLFNNKNFHFAEYWKNTQQAREIYVIRMLPIYDVKIKLKNKLHGKSFNNFLLNFSENKIQFYKESVDISKISRNNKIPL
ncbi:hypothetical protein [Candidatus Profftella armatura]|uniref:hypothetical protein n=1 Tax=Candidatus Profftella armatura TaxID=669502 RepID=UPI0006AF47B3|nr:hypothetical protein [Candidatus Profftella armatura]ALC95936.1 hypothetical protein AMC77_00735 [Candidatus Profftella armatura]QLK13746.1 hypothetical protein FK495_00735 [Candidatus Profftella armatura]